MTPEERAARVLARADELGQISEDEGRLTRRFATPALAEAGRLIAGWMTEAGLVVTVDPVGNVRGRNGSAGAPLVLGSHYDTVRDAGRYDGPLGVLCAIEVAGAAGDSGGPLEVVAFSDEEGARFAVAYLGSSAYRGRFDRAWLELEDAGGITMAAALSAAGADVGSLRDLRLQQAVASGPAGAAAPEIAAYVEVHIEQGPVLETEGLPVGVVSSICGQTRLRVAITGRAAHAGTVPAGLRADALTGAAELVLAVEHELRESEGLVATVGELVVEPGASNVVPGRVALSIDVRHADDAARESAVARLEARARALVDERQLGLDWSVVQSTSATVMDAELTACLCEAVAARGLPVRRLVSGAGHDGVVLAEDAPVAMLFVRCRGGVSHSPLESVEAADVAVALLVVDDAVKRLAAPRAG